MRKKCVVCKKDFSNRIKINDKWKNGQNRTSCYECLPFGTRRGKARRDLVVETSGIKEIKCNWCQEIKSIEHYSVRIDKKKKGNFRAECKKCLNKYTIDRMRKAKEEAVASFGGKCLDCNGVFRPEIYDFHHLDPSQKDLDWRKIRQRTSESRIEELKKCVLLCSNCHRTRHAEENDKKKELSDGDSYSKL